MDSMPPATTTFALPVESSSNAIIAAFMPEPHILFTVVAGVVFCRPALIAAWRAGACPWPACRTQPKITSSTSEGFTPACSTAALMAVAPSSEAETLLNLPCMAPMGVRLAPTMTMLSMKFLAFRSNRFFEELPADEHAADLVGARADVVELRIAEQPARGEFVDVAVAAERLDRFQRDPHRVLGGEEEARRGVLARGAPTALVERRRDPVAESARGLQLRVHVRDLSLHQLEGADRGVELLALEIGRAHV